MSCILYYSLLFLPPPEARKNGKNTTGKAVQTLVQCLGIFHGKPPIIFDRISAPHKLSYYALVTSARSVPAAVFNQPCNWEKAWHVLKKLSFISNRLKLLVYLGFPALPPKLPFFLPKSSAPRFLLVWLKQE